MNADKREAGYKITQICPYCGTKHGAETRCPKCEEDPIAGSFRSAKAALRGGGPPLSYEMLQKANEFLDSTNPRQDKIDRLMDTMFQFDCMERFAKCLLEMPCANRAEMETTYNALRMEKEEMRLELRNLERGT